MTAIHDRTINANYYKQREIEQLQETYALLLREQETNAKQVAVRDVLPELTKVRAKLMELHGL